MTDPAPLPSSAEAVLDSPSGGRLMKTATVASVCVAVVLVCAKLVAWLMTGSVAVLSTLIDSLLDVGASALTLFAVRTALIPADENHRFGHGKAEALAGLGQAAFIAGSGVFLMIQAVDRLFSPVAVRSNEIGIAVMVLSILLTLALVTFQKYVVRKTHSVAIDGDSLHYTGDMLMNLSVIASLVIGMVVDVPLLDPILGIVIVIFLIRSAWTIGSRSVNMLMDRELPEEDRRKILDLCFKNPNVMDVHDLRTRRSGQTTFIQLHLDLNGDQSLREAHAVASVLYTELAALFPGSEILIHEDPLGDDDKNHPPFAFADSRMPHSGE